MDLDVRVPRPPPARAMTRWAAASTRATSTARSRRMKLTRRIIPRASGARARADAVCRRRARAIETDAMTSPRGRNGPGVTWG